MGIYDWVTSLTGSWGPSLLSAYEANALWINGAVVVYGLLLALSWQNADRIVDALLRQIMEGASGARGRGQGSLRRVRLSALRLSWEDALSASRFPLFARQADFIPRRCTRENVRRMITGEYLLKRAAARLKRQGVELEP